jgi:uncharacterized protein (TIGR02996 family)
MDTEAALLAAMAAAPDDDTPRLVYADWLEENGQPERAELIRLQCRPADDTAAHARAEELLQAHRAAWDRPLRLLKGEVHYRRGFPHFLKADFALIVKHQALLALAPDWHLCPTRGDHDYDESQADLCASLSTGPVADRIRGLNLAWAGWLPEETEALLAPPLVGRLREVRFGDDDRGRHVLNLLRRYRELRLETLGFGGDSYGGIGDEGCRVVASDRRLAALTALELPNNDLSAAGIAALAGSPHVTRLRRLDLEGGSNSSNSIGDEGARHLAGSANFRHLSDLNLACNGIRDAGFFALLRSPHLVSLANLNVPSNGHTDAALVALAESDGLPALSWLNVSGGMPTAVTAAAVARLAGSARMERLKGLKLGGYRIGDEGALALAESPHCRNLRELYVGNCGIGAAAFARLLESPHLAGVPKFSTSGNGLTQNEIASLRRRHGNRVG